MSKQIVVSIFFLFFLSFFSVAHANTQNNAESVGSASLQVVLRGSCENGELEKIDIDYPNRPSFRLINPQVDSRMDSVNFFPYNGGRGPKEQLEQFYINFQTAEVFLRSDKMSTWTRIGTIIALKDGSLKSSCQMKPIFDFHDWFTVEKDADISVSISLNKIRCERQGATVPILDRGYFIRLVSYNVNFKQNNNQLLNLTAEGEVSPEKGSGTVYKTRKECEADTGRPW